MATIEIEVTQMLVFLEGETKSNPQGLFASDSISFVDHAKNYRQWVSASSHLNVGQVAVVRKSVCNLSVGQFIEFHDGGHKSAGQQDVVQWINFGSLARVVEYEIVTQQLSLSQSAVVDYVKPGFDTLVMTQVVGLRLVRSRVCSQTLVVHSGGVCVVEDDDRYSIPLPTLTGPNAPEC